MHALMLERSYPDLSKQIPKYASNIRESIDLCYFEDGSNTEGPAYWGATTRFVAYSLPLMARALNRPLSDLVPQRLIKSIETPIYLRSMAADDFFLLGINDASYSEWNPGVSALFLASILNDPLAQWVWGETTGRRADRKPAPSIEALLSVLWSREMAEVPRPKFALARQFRGSPGIVMRSGWDVGDVFFCLQCGAWGSGHQDADKNAFVLEAFGERLCPDPGTPAYGSASNFLYKSTAMHNTITINGANQQSGDPQVLKFSHDETADIVESDATACYPGASKVLRRVLYRRPGYFVISDEVTTKEPSSVEFNLHTFSEISVEADSIFFNGQQADMLVKVIAPGRFHHTLSSLPGPHGGRDLQNLQLVPTQPATNVHYLTVLYPLRKGTPRPQITSEHAGSETVIHVDDDVIVWQPDEGLRLRKE